MAAYKHRYTPPTQLQDVPGVTRRSSEYEDSYVGTKEKLIAVGLLREGQFPGDEGMPLSRATLWPLDAPHASGWDTPGRLRITRSLGGTFCASLMVSREEQQRRCDELKRRRDEAEKERVAALPRRTPTAHEVWLAGIKNTIAPMNFEQRGAAIDQLREAVRTGKSSAYLASEVACLILKIDEAEGWARRDARFQRFMGKVLCR